MEGQPSEDTVISDPYLLPAPRPIVDELAQHELVWAKNQPEYLPLRSLPSHTPEGIVMSRWTLTAEQRQAVREGADIFVQQLTFGDLLQPISLLTAHRLCHCIFLNSAARDISIYRCRAVNFCFDPKCVDV